MRQVKVYLADTECLNCHTKVNRKRAEAADWVEVVFVDQTGMSVSKGTLCNVCEESWTPDLYSAPALPNVIATPAAV